MPDTRSVAIGRDAHGSAIVTGDHAQVVFVYADERRALRCELPDFEQKSPSLAAFPTCNPYLGLDAFTEAESDRFFGREALVDKLWERLRDLCALPAADQPVRRFLAIVGPSGSGKSSVARAGLLTEIAKRSLPGMRRAKVVVLTPGERPLEALAGGLARAATGEVAPVAKQREFRQELAQTIEAGAWDGLRRIAAALPDVSGTRLIILVDQCEELFTQCSNEVERSQFIGNLMHAVLNRSGHVCIVVTLRADFLRQTQRYPEFNAAVADGVMVAAMSESELRLAIAEPAKRAGHPFDPAVVELLVAETRGREGALPLLQFALTRLWEGMGRGEEPTDVLAKMGGVGGALASQAQRFFDQLPSEKSKRIARRLFVRSAHYGDGASVARRRVPLKSLVAQGETVEDVHAVIGFFSQPGARVVTIAESEGEAIEEVTHEALFEHWKELKKWLRASREDQLFLRRLEEDVRHWQTNREPEGLLWRSPDLDQLQRFHARAADELTADQARFYELSVRAERRRKSRRTLAIMALAVLAVTASISAVGMHFFREAAKLEAANAEEAARRERVGRHLLARRGAEDAEQRQQHDLAALWLDAAIRAGRNVQLDTARDEWALRYQIALCHEVQWIRQGWPSVLNWRQGTADGPIWALAAGNRIIRIDPLRPDAWRAFEAPALDRQTSYKIELHPRLGIVLLNANGIWRVSGLAAPLEPLWEFPGAQAHQALDDTPEGDFYLCVDQELIRFSPERSTVVTRWRLPDDLVAYQTVVDEVGRHAVIAARRDGVRKLVVVHLDTGTVVAEYERPPIGYDGLLPAGKHAVLFGADAPAEIFVVDFQRPAEVTSWKSPWPVVGFLGYADKRLEIAHGDSKVRIWELDGRLIETKLLASGGDISSAARLPSGVWSQGAMGFTQCSSDCGSCRSTVAMAGHAAKLRVLSDGRLLVAGHSRVDFRDGRTGALERTVPRMAGDAAWDSRTGHLVTLDVGPNPWLREIDLETEKELARLSLDGALLVPLPGDRGLAVFTGGSVHRVSLPGLHKQEVLFSGAPSACSVDDEGVWMAWLNNQAGRFELWRYTWAEAQRRGPLLVAVDAGSINTAALLLNQEHFLWALNDGGVCGVTLPHDLRRRHEVAPEDVRQIGPRRGDRITTLQIIPDGRLAIARQIGAVDCVSIATSSDVPAEQPVQSMAVVRDEIVEIANGPDRKSWLRLENGDFGLVSWAQAAIQTHKPLPPRGVRGHWIGATLDAFYVPKGTRVVEWKAGEARSFTPAAGSAGDFRWVLASPGGTRLAAHTGADLFIWDLTQEKSPSTPGLPLRETPEGAWQYLDEDRLALLQRDEVLVLDVRTPSAPKPQSRISCPGLRALTRGVTRCFAVSDQWVAICDGHTALVRLFSLADGAELGRMMLADIPGALAFAGANERVLLAGGDDCVTVLSLPALERRGVVNLVSANSRAEPRTIRALLPVPGTDLFLAGGHLQSHFARVGISEPFARAPAADEILRFVLARDGRSALAYGDAAATVLSLPPLAEEVPSTEEVARAVDRHFDGGDIVIMARSIEITPPRP